MPVFLPPLCPDCGRAPGQQHQYWCPDDGPVEGPKRAMTDKPIPFSADMIRALLDGRKTQTRRVITKAAVLDALSVFGPDFLTLPGNRDLLPINVVPGDRLWVREAWATVNSAAGPGFAYRANGEFIQPEYDGEDFGAGPSFDYDKYPGDYSMWFDDLLAREQDHRWRPSIHMPRWASRLTLTVTDVRVQRVREIGEADAVAEGVESDSDGWRDYQMPNTQCCGTALESFRTLWDSLNAPRGYGWDANPFVAAYTFTVARQNIDQVTK